MLFRRVLITLILFCVVASSSWAQPPEMPGQRDRCPVCGMFVAPYSEWIATIVQTDGTQVFFDGCKDLFRYYFKLSEDELALVQEIYVTEYYRTQLVPARDVFYVIGSDVYGPMGKELIPIAGQKNADTFMQDHNGRSVLSFDQLTIELLPGD